MDERERALVAQRLNRWPVSFRSSHFRDLEVDERRLVAQLVLLLDARPEFATLAPEPTIEQLALAVEPEPEQTWPDWKSERARHERRELHPSAVDFLRRHGLR